MGIPDPAFESYLINGAQTRASELIRLFAGQQPTEREAIFARVNAVLDDYCAALLEDLRHAIGTIDDSEARVASKTLSTTDRGVCNEPARFDSRSGVSTCCRAGDSVQGAGART